MEPCIQCGDVVFGDKCCRCGERIHEEATSIYIYDITALDAGRFAAFLSLRPVRFRKACYTNIIPPSCAIMTGPRINDCNINNITVVDAGILRNQTSFKRKTVEGR